MHYQTISTLFYIVYNNYNNLIILHDKFLTVLYVISL